MMRKKISWLFLLTVLLTLFSCRNDVFPEQDLNSNNSSKFQLTSKRISLSQSKHKVKLLPELEKAKRGFEAKNTAGKVVHYGNGVSINTDDVVYIEYGPYHTYTFKINRDNASADAPVENLILSLEPDGTYKELIKTYNLTQNDWHELSLGNGIDLHGKTTTVEVAKGTYNQALTKVAGSGCYYESQQVYQACCHGVHGEGNIGDWGNCTCTGAGLPKMYTIEILVCNPEPGAPTGGWTPTPSSPTAPTGGGEPLDGGNSSGSQTNPTDPNTVEGAQGELGGTPTLPNLGLHPNNPCEKANQANIKAKELLNQAKINAAITTAGATVATDPFEKGFNFGTKDDGSYTTGDIKVGTESGINLPPTDYEFTVTGSLHTHNGDAYECFAPNDFYIFQTANKYNANFSTAFVLGSSGGMYNIFITDLTKFKNFKNNYPKADYIDGAAWKEGSSIEIDFKKVKRHFEKHGKTDDEAFALAQAYVLRKYDTGMSISKKLPNGSFKTLFVKESKDPNDLNETIYEQTDDCNL
ncbi:hypothetical protein [Chryseobacterium sp. CCH4-E10]|uniref:hypothetical protein n=1 Tax=Chryseobacterium sp. CCH4-E10 TaxID=1768758 RepID=UPI000B2EEEFF|nr:hypothetical protein [Chryseobacterium sp. CCH4-E10]